MTIFTKADSTIAAYGALAANVRLHVTQFVAAGVSGSSAMRCKGIHSAVDAGHGRLLLVGLHMAKKRVTPEHPFGRGKALYFWSLIVAVLVFGLGDGMSIYEGVMHMRQPEPLTRPGAAWCWPWQRCWRAPASWLAWGWPPPASGPATA